MAPLTNITHTKKRRRVIIIGCVVIVLSLAVLVYRSGAVVCTPSGTTTAILQLCKPASGETGWTTAINANWDLLDGLFGTGNILKVANGGTGLSSPGATGNVLTSNGTAWVSQPGGGGGNSVPTGGIILWGASTAPTGFLLCNGSAVSRTTYATLFGVIGTTFGAGDGSTTFNLPDLRGRVAVGTGQGTGLTNRVLGAMGGEETHMLTTAEMPSHTHAFPNGIENQINPADASGGGSFGATSSSSNISTAPAGGGGAHNVMQPFLVLSFHIKT